MSRIASVNWRIQARQVKLIRRPRAIGQIRVAHGVDAPTWMAPACVHWWLTASVKRSVTLRLELDAPPAARGCAEAWCHLVRAVRQPAVSGLHGQRLRRGHEEDGVLRLDVHGLTGGVLGEGDGASEAGDGGQ
jgi:hypothetical protein